MPYEVDSVSYFGGWARARPRLAYSGSLAVSACHVWCSQPTCAESMVLSTPCSQLQGIRHTHQYRYSATSQGNSGAGGASLPPSHTHANPAASRTGKCSTSTFAANCSWRTSCVGASTTQPETSIFQPW